MAVPAHDERDLNLLKIGIEIRQVIFPMVMRKKVTTLPGPGIMVNLANMTEWMPMPANPKIITDLLKPKSQRR